MNLCRGAAADEARAVATNGYHDKVSRRSPALAVGLGIVLLALGFIVPGTSRDLILRVVGGLALLAGGAMWVASRRA